MSRQTLFRIFLILLAASLLKHLWLARYCHPMADDWSYAHQGITRDLLPWLYGEYLHWNGRYFSNILVGNGPLVLGLDALWFYRLVPVALMLFTVIAAHALVGALTTDHRQVGVKHASGRTARGTLSAWAQWGAALLFFALFIQGMPDIREGYYWYTGAITYQLGNILALFHVARVVRSLQHNAARKPLTIAFDALLLVVIIGCSEVHMVLMVVFHSAMIAWRWRIGGAVRRGDMLLPLVAVICAAVVIIAPGNAVRSALFTGTHDPLHSLWMSALQTLRFAGLWSVNVALLLVSVLYVPVSRSLAPRSPLFKNAFHMKPWMSTIALPGIIFLCVFPAYWGTGILGQHRTVNVAYCFFLLLWFINITVWDTHVFQRRCFSTPRWRGALRPTPAELLEVTMQRLSTRWTAIILVAVLAFINVGRNGGRASRDLFSGRAERFDAQLTERYTLLEEARLRTSAVVLPAIAQPPETLYLLELRDDPMDWVNQCYALYFGMEGRPVARGPAP